MISVFIYTPLQEQADKIAESLLQNGLVAHVSIDKDNNSFKWVNGKVVKEKLSLIVGQTKALLFNEINIFITENFGDNFRIYSIPITQTNTMFYKDIIENTKNN